MKTLLFATLLIISTGFLWAEDAAPAVDLNATKVFITKLVERLEAQRAKANPAIAHEYIVLKAEPAPEDPSERAALAWMKSVLASSDNKALITRHTKKIQFSFWTENLGELSPSVLKLHQRGNPKDALDPKKTYLVFHFGAEGLTSDPAYYGVIDPDGPKLLSFMGDGGA